MSTSSVVEFFSALQDYLEGKDDHEVVLEYGYGFLSQDIWLRIAQKAGIDLLDFSDDKEFPVVGREVYYRRTGYMSSVTLYYVTAGDLRAQCLRALGPMPLPVYEGPVLTGPVGPVRCYTLSVEGISFHGGEIAVGDEGRGRREERVSVVGAEVAGKLLYAEVETVAVQEMRRFVPVVMAAEESIDERYALMLLNTAGGHRGSVSYDLPKGAVVLATGHVAQGLAGAMGGWDEMLVLVPTSTEIRYYTSGGGGHIGGAHWLLVGCDSVRHEDESHRLQRLALEKVAAKKAAGVQPAAAPLNFYLLSGDRVEAGVHLAEAGRLTCYDGQVAALLAVSVDPEAKTLERVRVDRDSNGTVVLTPTEAPADPERKLVLVHEYSPGSGAKRWPSFYIDWASGPSVDKLAEVSRNRGSGSDTWTLVIAPADWARNIADQFVNERDVPGQTIGYHAPSESVREASVLSEPTSSQPVALSEAASAVAGNTAVFTELPNRYFKCRCGGSTRAAKSDWKRYEQGEAINIPCSHCGASGVCQSS